MTAGLIGGDFICGDWGTSRLRLFLCDAAGTVLARAEGPGIGESGARAAEILAGLTAAWDKTLPVMLSGMVGSSIGWREAPYCPCPAAPQAIAREALRFDADGRRIAIAPGLSCRNASGLFDVMRGEETQLLGALRLMPQLAEGRHLFCLPGTHAKWVLVEDGVVVRFQTALSGELFALLSRHSVLARGAGPVSPGHAAFAEGLRTAREQDTAGLAQLLFSSRTRQLDGEIAPAEAASYLSGLIIGTEIEAALRLFVPRESIVLVGAPALTALYAPALAARALSATVIDGDAAALAGLTFLHGRLFGAPS